MGLLRRKNRLDRAERLQRGCDDEAALLRAEQPIPARTPPLIYNPAGGTRSHYARPDGGPRCGASSSGGWAGQGSSEERAWAAHLQLCGLCRDWPAS